MWQRVRDWAFPEPSPDERYRGRWHRFTQEHGGLVLLGSLPILVAIYAALFGLMFLLHYFHLVEAVIWAWAGIFGIGIFFGVIKAFRAEALFGWISLAAIAFFALALIR